MRGAADRAFKLSKAKISHNFDKFDSIDDVKRREIDGCKDEAREAVDAVEGNSLMISASFFAFFHPLLPLASHRQEVSQFLKFRNCEPQFQGIQ